MKELEEILRSKYVPKVCSNEFFNHCLESDSYNMVNMALQAMRATYNKGVTEKNQKIDSLLSYCKKAYEKTSAPEKVMNNVNEQYYSGVSETYNIIIDKLKEILKEETLIP